MIGLSVKLGEKFALDFSCLHMVRSFRDGITVFKPKINIDYFKGDHNPKLEISLEILNLMIFELNIYNVNHIAA
jgi:hypothetical protein